MLYKNGKFNLETIHEDEYIFVQNIKSKKQKIVIMCKKDWQEIKNITKVEKWKRYCLSRITNIIV